MTEESARKSSGVLTLTALGDRVSDSYKATLAVEVSSD